MDVEVRKSHMEDIIAYCREKAPEEACGALLGRAAAHTIRITGWRPIRNAAERPRTAFSFDMEEWIPLVTGNQGRRIIGMFHSHPDTSPIPSVADLALEWTFRTYWIVAIGRDPFPPEIKLYKPNRSLDWSEQALRLMD